MNLTIKQCFRLLGLPEDSSAQEAREAYQRLASAYHPDHNPLSGNMFIQMTKAYRTLSEFFLHQAKSQVAVPENLKAENKALMASRERRGQRGRPTDRRFEIVLESSYLGTSIREHI